MSQKLYLIPNGISPKSIFLLSAIFPIEVKNIRFFLVEEQKSAQRLLKKINPEFPMKECSFVDLNEHTPEHEIKNYFNQAGGKDMGLISESGCPCVADPGSNFVLLAHKYNVEVIPLVGPSSIILALMASGLNGQNFAFNGYLPKQKEERIKKIKLLELRSLHESQTQIFMEAPYRNDQILSDVLSCCSRQTFLSVAVDLTSPNQSVKTQSIGDWMNFKNSLNDKLVLFLLHNPGFCNSKIRPKG